MSRGIASNSDSSRRAGSSVSGARAGSVVDRGGQVGQEAARVGERLVLAVGRLVDRAGAQLDLPAAQLLLVVLLGAEAIHHRRPGDEHRRDLLHHHRVVRGREPRRAEARDRAEAQADRRHGAHVVDHHLPAAHARHVGAAGGLDGLDRAAAARALDHADQRHAKLVGVALDEELLLLDRGVGRAAAHGEVVAGHRDVPAVDLGAAHHGVGRRQLHQVVLAVVVGLAGDAADLAEAVLVDQPVDALAHGEPAAVVLALHLVGAAHLLRHLLAAAQLVEFRLPDIQRFPLICFTGSDRSFVPTAAPESARLKGAGAREGGETDRWTKPARAASCSWRASFWAACSCGPASARCRATTRPRSS